MAIEYRNRRAGRTIPQPRGLIVRCCCHARVIGAERRAQHVVRVTLQDGDLFSGLGVPKPRGRSADAVTTRLPSWLKAAPITVLMCPFKTASSAPVDPSQSRAV